MNQKTWEESISCTRFEEGAYRTLYCMNNSVNETTIINKTPGLE
jgi:hypothetical protein